MSHNHAYNTFSLVDWKANSINLFILIPQGAKVIEVYCIYSNSEAVGSVTNNPSNVLSLEDNN
jgi:hypothetical protein